MVTGPDGQLPLPWLEQPLAQLIAQRHGQALLIHGGADIGALELAVAFAQGQLCEAPGAQGRPCGHCASCHLVQTRVHPDLLLLMPEAQRQQRRWPLAIDKADTDSGDEGKARKRASRQIRIEEVRLALDWASSTASRGGLKLLVVSPAEALNVHAASALLKTLEEPPRAVRIVLTTADPALLLPTIRSRCRVWAQPLPAAQQALAWLQASGVAEPAVLLAASGGQPLRAQALFAAGIDATTWRALPRSLARGESAALTGWPLERLLDAMLRLCHDLTRMAAGGAPLFFESASLGPGPSMHACVEWQQELLRVSQHAEHPLQEGLLLESLVLSARRALQGADKRARGHRPFDTLPT